MEQQRKYEYLRNLDKKIIKFEELENKSVFPAGIEKIKNPKKVREILEEKSKIKSKIEEARKAFEKIKETQEYPYYSDEYDELRDLEETLCDLDRKLKLEIIYVEKKKPDFDINNFFVFLSNVLTIEISDIKDLFGSASNDLIEEMRDENYSNLEYIQNKYNANVNCFNLTGKYIKDFDKTSFENKHPEVFYYFEYAQVVGLFDEDDIYYIVNEDRNNGGVEEPYTPEEYCYTAFYKNSPNMYNEIICINYLKDKIEKLSLLDHIDICDLGYLMSDLKKTKFNTKEPEKFKKDIDDFIASYDLSKSLLYTDSDNVIANSNPDNPSSEASGKGFM